MTGELLASELLNVLDIGKVKSNFNLDIVPISSINPITLHYNGLEIDSSFIMQTQTFKNYQKLEVSDLVLILNLQDTFIIIDKVVE